MTDRQLEKIVERGKEVFRKEGEAKPKKCPMCEDPNFLPSHRGSGLCRSGSLASGGNRPHCTCRACF